MGSNILGIGQSALNAAQIGLSTTGHNIANAATPGYSRQVVIQGAALPQGFGYGFVGQGTQVNDIKRMYSDFLGTQVLTAQTSKSQLDSYNTQITQIDNLLADPSAGLSPALQDFFKGVQDLAANPSAAASRQAMLSSADALTSRFQGLEGRLDEIRQGVNSQIQSSVDSINSYSQQIAKLNDTIEKVQSATDGKAANDLLDQRDQLVADLSKEIKVIVVPQDGKYSIFIGNGQPLVVGVQTFALKATVSQTDASRTEVAFETGGKTVLIAESNLPGGKLGGLMEFRSKTLDVAQNSLGRVAIGLASTFNAQHRLGQDSSGKLGGDFFSVAAPVVTSSSENTSNAQLSASISDVNALTTSDYRLQVVSAPTTLLPNNGTYKITRLSDGEITNTGFPATKDGVIFDLKAGFNMPAAGDEFLIRPTADGASGFDVKITDTASIAAAAPIRTAAVSTNSGSGKISAGVFNSAPGTASVTLSYDTAAQTLSGFPAYPVTVTNGSTATTIQSPNPVLYTAGATVSYGGISFVLPAADVSASTTQLVTTGALSTSTTLSYDSTTNSLSGFPALLPVDVTGGVANPYTGSVPYMPGATISFGGVSFTLSGTPANGDKFSISPNDKGVGDSRNALLLGSLLNANTLANGSTTYQGAYAQLVSLVGNKANELQVTSKASETLLTQAQQAQQAESGVNLDEEAANLLRYQQAYQAAGKVMQIASQMFDVLLSLGK